MEHDRAAGGKRQPAPAAGDGRRRQGRELKKRISLSVLPSLYEDIQKIAYVQRCSVSELIGDLLEGYRAEHEDDIQRYKNLVKKINLLFNKK